MNENRSQGVSLRQGKAGEVRGVTLVIRDHGIDKNLEGRLVLQAAGLLEREYPLHPAAAFIGVALETAFAPEHRETDNPFHEVVGWLHAGPH